MILKQPHSTPDKIVNAARKLFVKQGYAATSVAKIASLAKVTHSLIFHHFGNKENLWVAVKQNIVDEANQQQSTFPSLDLSLPEFIRQAVINIQQFYDHNPDIVQMIIWQRIEYDNWQKAGISCSKGFDEWVNLFSEYQARGKIKASVTPEFIVILLFSIINTMILDPIAYIQNEDNFKAYTDFCVASLCEILQ